MPFEEDMRLYDDGSSPLRVESDLLYSVEDRDNGPSVPGEDGEALSMSGGLQVGMTVVALDADHYQDDHDVERQLAGSGSLSSSPGPAPELPTTTPPTVRRKRGRPPRSSTATPAAESTPAKTPAKGRTPKSTKAAPSTSTTGTSGRKRKLTEPETKASDESTAKRGRPARTARAAAIERLADTASTRPRRGQTKAATADAPNGKGAAPAKSKANGKFGRGRKSSSKSEASSADEYEVEAIVDSAIDADTMEHKYLVKWKGYGSNQNTWEPKSNLSGSASLLRDFDAARKKREAADAAKAAAQSKTAATEPRAKRGRKPKAVKPVKEPKKTPGRRGRPPKNKDRGKA